MKTPELLSDPVYHDEDAARAYLERTRWPEYVTCPLCGSLEKISPLKGESMGPVNDSIRERMKREQTDIKYEIEWRTLSEYLYFLERRGVSQNVASFIGATTIREHVVGLEDRKPTPSELDRMREAAGGGKAWIKLRSKNASAGAGF